MKSRTQTSKFLALILRHSPWSVGITLDANGWANIDELLTGLNKSGHHIDQMHLEDIVDNDDKNRYEINFDGTKIRARQGHSLEVDLNLSPVEPPEELYHGTAEDRVHSIMVKGISRQSRQYVHLSPNAITAQKVGSRHGIPKVLTVHAGKMHKDGFVFYLSTNGVWLTDNVPPEYVKENNS